MSYFKNKKKAALVPSAPRSQNDIDKEYQALVAKLGELHFMHTVKLPGEMDALRRRIHELAMESRERAKLDEAFNSVGNKNEIPIKS